MASRIVNMTVPEELLKEVDAVARAEGRTRSELFREAVRRYVQERCTKDASRLLLRLAALAVQGPNISASDLDRVLYGRGRTR
ncbi:MAG: CopG family ribbon-helix-helix protein [Candidatus Bipolaricaulia bacterium]